MALDTKDEELEKNKLFKINFWFENDKNYGIRFYDYLSY